MNVNPQSSQFGDVVPWDSLTDEQKQSGDWIELPTVANEPPRARRRSVADRIFPPVASDQQTADLNAAFGRFKGEFDALGKPR